jgi:hypothetical protein
MPEINGKQVLFRAKLPSSIWWPLLPTLSRLGGSDNPLEVLDWPTVCQMVAGSVKSWEFDGEPDDPKAVGELDAFNELTPLVKAISEMIAERAPSGEAGSAST